MGTVALAVVIAPVGVPTITEVSEITAVMESTVEVTDSTIEETELSGSA
jgi:hypothetical protein